MKKRECPCCGRKWRTKKSTWELARKLIQTGRLPDDRTPMFFGYTPPEPMERTASPTADAGELTWVERDKKKARKQLRDAHPANVWRRTNISYTAPKEMEGAVSPTTGREVKWDSVVPGLSLEERKLRRARQKKGYMKAYHARKKVERENAAQDERVQRAVGSVRRARAGDSQLEHQRAYNRAYYHRKKARIKELRDARSAKKRASGRVDPTTVTLQ
jgi:hypothetical protein